MFQVRNRDFQNFSQLIIQISLRVFIRSWERTHPILRNPIIATLISSMQGVNTARKYRDFCDTSRYFCDNKNISFKKLQILIKLFINYSLLTLQKIGNIIRV
jgi:hypothetical protein